MRRLVNETRNFQNLIQAWRSENIPDITQGAAENAGDAFYLDHQAAVTRQNIFMAVGIVPVEFAAGIATVVFARVVYGNLVANQQLGPDLVNINITGIVKHVGGEAAGRPHIDFQGHVAVSRRLEEFDVKKSFAYLESPVLMALAKAIFCILIIAILLLFRMQI